MNFFAELRHRNVLRAAIYRAKAVAFDPKETFATGTFQVG
jgi:hypothetical protein